MGAGQGAETLVVLDAVLLEQVLNAAGEALGIGWRETEDGVSVNAIRVRGGTARATATIVCLPAFDFLLPASFVP